MNNSHRLNLKLRARCGILAVLSGNNQNIDSFFLWLLYKLTDKYYCLDAIKPNGLIFGLPDSDQASRLFLFIHKLTVRRLCYA